jgi:hypothetical protein
MMTWRMILLGIGIGPALPIYLLAVQNSVNPHEMGAATSSSQFFRQIGSTVGVAIFGTILATTLSAQLPKYMPHETQKSGAAAISFNMGQLESGNFSAVGDQIRAGMQSTYAAIEAAVTKNDAAARESVLADPRLPSMLKDLVRNGGAAAQAALPQIRAALDAQAARVTGEITGALKNAFTDAITRVYFWGLFVVALGFLVTLFLPELALRKTRGAAHAAAGGGGAPSAEPGGMGGQVPAASPASPES